MKRNWVLCLRLLPVSVWAALEVMFAHAQTADATAVWLPYFPDEGGVLPTYGASIAVDPAGGVHTVYTIYSGAEQNKRPAVYAYCPGNCGDQASWTFTRLGNAVQDAHIALDPAGHPRIVLFGPRPDPSTDLRMQYQYAECEGGCGDAHNWKVITLVTPIEAIATREENNNRYFAVGPSGQAAFIYTDTSNNNHPGTFYMYCPGGCSDPVNWTETTLSSDFLVDKPSLAFAPDGRPRLAFGLVEDGDLYLAYGESDGDGRDPSGWSSTLLAKIHGSAFYNLRVNRRGEPRLAFSSGSYAVAPFVDHQLFYLWCTNGCTSGAGPWEFNTTGPFFASGAVDLALDREDHPRISFSGGTGLELVWCNTNAEVTQAEWNHQVIETSEALAAFYDVLPIHKCTLSGWINGQRSSLALDPGGHATFSYDAQHMWNGVYVDHPWESCNFKDITVARFASLTLTTGPELTIQRVGFDLELTFGGGTLQGASDLRGPWITVTDAQSPWRINPKEARRFYRIK